MRSVDVARQQDIFVMAANTLLRTLAVILSLIGHRGFTAVTIPAVNNNK